MKLNKQPSKLAQQKARKFEIELLEKEILDLKGEKRDQAMKAYRKLLSTQTDKPLYLTRSE